MLPVLFILFDETSRKNDIVKMIRVMYTAA